MGLAWCPTPLRPSPPVQRGAVQRRAQQQEGNTHMTADTATETKTIAGRELALDQLLRDRFNWYLHKTVGDDPVYWIVTVEKLTGPRPRDAGDVFTLKTTDAFTLEKAEEWAADELERWKKAGA